MLFVAHTRRAAVSVATSEGEVVGEHEQQHEPEQRRAACDEWFRVLQRGQLAARIQQMHAQRERGCVAETVGDDKVVNVLIDDIQRAPILELLTSLPRCHRQHIERCETRSEF